MFPIHCLYLDVFSNELGWIISKHVARFPLNIVAVLQRVSRWILWLYCSAFPAEYCGCTAARFPLNIVAVLQRGSRWILWLYCSAVLCELSRHYFPGGRRKYCGRFLGLFAARSLSLSPVCLTPRRPLYSIFCPISHTVNFLDDLSSVWTSDIIIFCVPSDGGYSGYCVGHLAVSVNILGIFSEGPPWNFSILVGGGGFSPSSNRFLSALRRDSSRNPTVSLTINFA